jgi:hypothetical protein
VWRLKLLLVLALFIPIVVDIGANLFSRSQFWPPLLPGLYYGGIVIAGLEFGWRTGLGVALLGALSHSLIARLLYRSPFTQVEGRLTDASSMLGEVIRRAAMEDPDPAISLRIARRTVLQHGGTITLDQTGPLKKLISLTLPLYHGQEP